MRQTLVVVFLSESPPIVREVKNLEGGGEEFQAVEVQVRIFQAKLLQSGARLEKGLKV